MILLIDREIKAVNLTKVTFYSVEESKRLSRKSLHQAKEAGEALFKLRQHYWDEVHGGKKTGWKQYISAALSVSAPKLNYSTAQQYLNVYTSWDIILQNKLETKTYSQVVYKYLPRLKKGLTLEIDFDDEDSDLPVHVQGTKADLKQDYFKSYQEHTESIVVDRDKYKSNWESALATIDLYKAKYGELT